MMRNTCKRLLCAAAALAMLTGCGGTKTALVPQDAVASLQSQLAFTDEMTEKDKDGACTFYDVDAALVADAAALVGSGATAESLSVWQAADADAAKQIVGALETFQTGWIDGYSDYKPEEVPKLESAVLEQRGDTVVFCVTADNDGAADAVKQLLDR